MSINASLINSYNGYLSSHNKVDKDEALQLIQIAQKLNQSGRGCCGFGALSGDQGLKELLNDRKYRDSFDSEGAGLIRYFLSHHSLPSGYDRPTPTRPTPTSPTTPTSPARPTPANEKVLIDWKAGTKAWNCWWWPMSTWAAGEGELGNLWVENGPLHKYDRAFGRRSREEELATHTSNVEWHGHCNRAAQVVSLLQEPRNNVVYNGETFTPDDIKGLLCEVIASLCTEEALRGNRNDGNPGDNPYDPAPYTFLKEILEPWTKAGETRPIILDIDPGVAVWNYVYDTVKVTESEKAPEGVSVFTPVGCKTKFYLCEMKGNGYPEQERSYQFWIQYDRDGKPMAQSWLPMKNSEDGRFNPDFGWRVHPRGDLKNPGTWKSDFEVQENRGIFAEEVFKLYSESIR